MALGIVLERVVIRPILGQPQFTIVMLTIGIGYLARGLITRRSHVLGFALPDMHGEYYSELIKGAENAARQLGYHLLITSLGAVPGDDRRAADTLGLVDDTYGLTITTVVVKPKSRGFVRLRSADPDDMPLVSPNLLADPEDRRSMIEGQRFFMRALETSPLKERIAEIRIPDPSDRSDDAILAHCRSEKRHVRGCWVVDLLLGRE